MYSHVYPSRVWRVHGARTCRYLRLKSTPRTERVKEDVLSLLAKLLPTAERPRQHLRTISQLFGTLRARGARLALSRLFAALVNLPQSPAELEAADAEGAQRDAPALALVGGLLCELNSFAEGEVDRGAASHACFITLIAC